MTWYSEGIYLRGEVQFCRRQWPLLLIRSVSWCGLWHIDISDFEDELLITTVPAIQEKDPE